ncbi:hypothetical protein BT93_K0522 [Corymbia citriodora subsp. variegata]|nr:hypothetical protein BT93_K0522 [Corymbia citriodora subsp. variegata]
MNQLTTEEEELIEHSEFSRGLTHVGEDTKAYELLTVELVSEAFGQNLNKVLSHLMEDEVLTIGICGIGGVGKTTFCDVPTLQQRISKCFNHVLREEEDKIKRAAELSHLLKRESTVIILDDLWQTYDLQQVGIPLGQMRCDELIKLESLPENEAWQLFAKNLGRGVVFAPEVESVARSVAKECGGLPLGIVVVSGSMRGKEDIHKWRSALKELKEAKYEGKGMEDRVFRVLKSSFIRLNDPIVQQYLLQKLVYLDFFSDLKSREAQYDRGHTIVNKLVNVDMAINMMGSQCMVKAGLGLSTLPAEEEWFEDLEKVSLIQNSLKEIPAARQQRQALPRLLELHLSANILGRIDVLDLSWARIMMLPSSISNLVNLTQQQLRHCTFLQHVPSLAKLRALRTLDLYKSELVNLRCLDFGWSTLKKLPPGILPKLYNLQTLCLKGWCNSLTDWDLELVESPSGVGVSFANVPICNRIVRLRGCHVRVDGPKSPPPVLPKDVQHLDIIDAVDELKSSMDIPSITNSKLTMCTLREIRGMKYVVSVSQSSSYPLPSLKFLILEGMMDLHVLAEQELCAAAPAIPEMLEEGNKFWGLKVLNINGCEKMKRLLTHVLLPLLANLEELSIEWCDQMEEVIAMTEANRVRHASSPSLHKMKTLKLRGLPALKSICTASISCHSLERASLGLCPKLDCISLLVRLPQDGEPPSNCLQEIQIHRDEEEWWKSVVWNHPLSRPLLDPYVRYWE